MIMHSTFVIISFGTLYIIGNSSSWSTVHLVYVVIVAPCIAATMGSSRGPDLSDVKIYRRSKNGVAPIAGLADSTGTLGSGGRKSRSPAVTGTGSLAAITAKDYPELVRRQLRWDSFSDVRSSARASPTGSPAAASFKGIGTRHCWKNLGFSENRPTKRIKLLVTKDRLG